ncbi:Outer membrane receptor proteins, mostly Fe transport [Lutibacter agarilyticus]|uniref:Outer membrane receptor proteins, mostly Fe transport n=1 Tax=Lutibacter agarilyticus TaxID=1109740 RepID=A0A238VJR8_9FLAO|nr:outer membrane beta-barrel family protein [Lutibacter agarilyticus]SNR34640.1 Outer membrane receptor proteins, mostly Fe transport [Lutibacter agarilyticus]
MRKIFFLCNLLLPLILIGQNNYSSTYTISGKIIDTATKLPIDYATIIFKSLDSGIVKYGGITNHKGHFSLDVSSGFYHTTVAFISYKTKQLAISEINHDINLGTIELELDTENLQEIEIQGSKKAIEVKANKLIFNVSKDIASESKMTTDVLNNIPSVAVDPTGAIRLNGLANPTILINGKVTVLSKADALKSLPASSIEKIEVISNPGASYQATSTGVINIILKKGKEEGFHTSATISGGYRNYYGGLVNLNYSSNKTNVYFYPSFVHKQDAQIATTETSYFNNGNPHANLSRNSNYTSTKNDFSSVLGADFKISKKSTLSGVVNYTAINANNTTKTTAILFDAASIETGSNNRTHKGKFNNDIFEATLSFDHFFKSEEQKLSSYFSYSNDDELYDFDILNSNPTFTDESYIEDNEINNYRAEVKYAAPINDSSNFVAGYYGEYGDIPFQYISEAATEHINYAENIHAVFAEYEKIMGDFYVGISLRAEFSDVTIDFEDVFTQKKNTYNNLFPAVYLDYMFNDEESITLSYTNKIGRPSYSQLQPFEQKYTETWSFVGNIHLKPVFYHLTRLSYTLSTSKFTFAPSLFFNRYNDYWQRVTYETGEQVQGIEKLITTPENVGYVNYYGIDFTAMYSPTNWLSFTGYVNLNIFDQHGVFETTNTVGEQIRLDYTNANFGGSQSLLTKIKIPKIVDFQVNVSHELLSQSNYSKRKAYTYTSLAINRDFWNNTASLSLNSNDVFNSFKTARDRFDASYYSEGILTNKFPTFIVSFTYRFNQKKHNKSVDFGKKDIKPEF